MKSITVKVDEETYENKYEETDDEVYENEYEEAAEDEYEEINPLKEKEQRKEEIKGIIFLIWFIGSIVIFMIAAMFENGHYIAVMNIGQYFLVFGIDAYCSSKEKITLVAPTIGLACIIIPLIMMCEHGNIDWDKIIPLIFLAVFVIVGLGLFFIPLIKYFNRKKLCSVTVPATIVKYDSILHRNHDTRMLKILYAPTYAYIYNGKEYKVKLDVYSNVDTKTIGSPIELRINPDNPTMILEPGIFGLLLVVGIEFFWLLLTVPLFIYYIINNF